VKERHGASQRELQEMAHDLSDVIWQQDAGLGLSSVVCRAASNGDLPRLQELLCDPELAKETDHGGRTPLHLAAAKGYTACVEFLTGKGADVNAKGGCVSPTLNGRAVCLPFLLHSLVNEWNRKSDGFC
jgi:ankyrin repeat protein